MKVPPGFESLLLRQKDGHPLGVHLFGFAAGFENQIRAAGGSLVDAGWTASKQLFSAQQKMQTNPCCSALPSGQQITILIEKNCIHCVYQAQKTGHPNGMSCFLGGQQGFERTARPEGG